MAKKARFLPTLFFSVLVLLPLLGLLIMDYQLKKANDITGAYLEAPVTAYASESAWTGLIVIASFVVILLLIFAVEKVRRSSGLSTSTLSKINDDISSLERKLEKKHRGR